MIFKITLIYGIIRTIKISVPQCFIYKTLQFDLFTQIIVNYFQLKQ
jgi:hypothetical protein